MADLGSKSLMMNPKAMQATLKSSRSFMITPTGRKILSCNTQHPKYMITRDGKKIPLDPPAKKQKINNSK